MKRPKKDDANAGPIEDERDGEGGVMVDGRSEGAGAGVLAVGRAARVARKAGSALGKSEEKMFFKYCSTITYNNK